MPWFEAAALRPGRGFVPAAAPGAASGAGFAPAGAGRPAPQPAGVALGPELEALRREAHEAGRQQGLAEGREAALAEARDEALRPVIGALEEAARGVAALRRDYLHVQRRALVDLAVAIAEKLLGRELAARPDDLSGIVERALEALGESGGERVELAPADLELLQQGALPTLVQLAEVHGLALEANPRLAPGDARVLSGASRVDARRAELLRRIAEELDELALGEGEAS